MLEIPQPRTTTHRLSPARRLLVLIAVLGDANLGSGPIFRVGTPRFTKKFQLISRKTKDVMSAGRSSLL